MGDFTTAEMPDWRKAIFAALKAATAASSSPGDIVGTGPIGFSCLRIIAEQPVRIICA